MKSPPRVRLCLAAVLAFAGATARAGDETAVGPSSEESLLTRQERSPWLLVPLLGSGPKLGTTLGLMGAYILRMDAQSSPSLVGVQAKWSDTGSQVVGAGGELYFHGNRDLLLFGVAGGHISNDYLDFLGTGQQVRSEENLSGLFMRYQHEFLPNLYLGAQAIRTNYGVRGLDPISEQMLDLAGLVGVNAAGVGLAFTYDSRDNKHNPSTGMLAQFNNVAYRESLGGDVSYDVYNADWRRYMLAGKNNVLALHAGGSWTHDAPPSREATVEMRGYTFGQYLGKNQLFFEAEDRYSVHPKWGPKVFAGLTCLYGDGKSCSGDQLYPMAGLGAFYVLKPKEHMLVSVEFAQGKGDNQGFYIRFGNSF